MADDDDDRDILPVKDGTCTVDTCRSTIGFLDPRERHTVCKLDRYQLEDRYLRLLEEVTRLKKLSNTQEDKLKRLGTKLMRTATNPGVCAVALNAYEDKNRIGVLERENSKLRDKISVLRSQLLNHTLVAKTSSRTCRPSFTRPSSGITTCRSESSRMRTPSCACIIRGNENNDTQNYLVKIEELELQKRDMSCRIAELEKKLTNYEVGNHREKIAENVEYIRVCRQMKQLNDKLQATEEANDSLKAQINELNRKLDETTKENQDTQSALMAEKKKLIDFDSELLKAKESQLTLREKDEQIRGLTNEMKILQQHNNELITVCTKYGQIETENAELRKKVSEQLCDQQTLRSAFNADQANIAALQAANEQLLQKLHELQKNIDTLTVQLTSFQQMKGRNDSSPVRGKASPRRPGRKTPEREESRQFAAQVEKCKKCCEAYDKILHLEKAVSTARMGSRWMDKNVQTDRPNIIPTIGMRDEAISVCISNDQKDEPPTPKQRSCVKKPNEESSAKAESLLSNEKMLKLLEQAQISAPLDSARMPQKAEVCVSSDFDGLPDMNRRTRDSEKMFERPKRKICWEEPIERENGNVDVTSPPVCPELNSARISDPNKILHMLLDMFQEYSSLFSAKNSMENEFQRFSSAGSYANQKQEKNKQRKIIKASKKRTRTDQNSTEDGVTLLGCASKKFCSAFGKAGLQTSEHVVVKKNQITIFTQTDSCSCVIGRRCNPNSDCGYQCSNYLSLSDNNCVTSEICQNGNGTFVDEWRTNNEDVAIKDIAQHEERLRSQLAQQLNKCKELLNVDCELGGIVEPCPAVSKQVPNRGEPVVDLCRDNDSGCNVKCPNVCQDVVNSTSDAFPLLITDEQGLVEIHIVCIQLSTSAPHILFRESNISNISVYLSWQMWDQEPAFTPALKCPKLNFNSSFVYRIPDLFKFFHCVLSEYVVFHVNVAQQSETTYAVARAKLCIKDILDYPQNKLHYITPVRLSCDIEKVEAFKKQCGIVSSVDAVECSGRKDKDSLLSAKAGRSIESGNGQDLRVLKEHSTSEALKASVEKMESGSIQSVPSPEPTNENIIPSSGYVNQLQHPAPPPPSERSNRQINYQNRHPPETSSEGYVPPRSSFGNKSLDVEEESSEDEHSQLKIDHAMKTMAYGDAEDSGMHSESASMKEFNALLADSNKDPPGSSSTIFDLNDVLSNAKWNEYRRRSQLHSDANREESQGGTADDEIGSSRAFPLEKDTIVIEVVNVTLFRKSSVMADDDVRLIYVEFSFLGHRGADMETVSVEKPRLSTDKMTYNFRKRFQIDEKTHAVERNTLRAMLEESINPNIKFVLVSEPLPEETDIKECVEIGVAFFNIREYALGDGYKNVPLPLMNPEQTQQIGILKLFILGLDAIRQCLGEES